MSLPEKYRPKTFSQLVGAETRREALGLVHDRLSSVRFEAGCVSWDRRPIAIVGPKGTGKTNGVARLLMKSHFCTQGPDGGPCGTCETCLHFDARFDHGDGYFSVPKAPSRTPTTQLDDSYYFKVYDFANITAEKIDYIVKEVAPAQSEHAAFFAKHPEVVLIDEAHRADKPKQDSVLTALDGKLHSTVILCVATSNLHKLDVGLWRRPYSLHIVPPEFGEMVAFAEDIAEKESIAISEKSALVELAEGAGGIPNNVLLMLDMARVQNSALTSAWVRRMLPRLPPPDSATAEAPNV